jgi:hypothetical protein
MRQLFVLAAAACCVAAFGASTASASPPSGGCPATASPITQVSYVLSPTANWKGTSLYAFMFVDTNAGQGTIEQFGLTTEEEAYFAFVSFLEAVVDVRNDDETACVYWLGGNPGRADYLILSNDNVVQAGD